MADPTFTIEIHGYRRNAEGGGLVDAIKELRRLLPDIGLAQAKRIVEKSEVEPAIMHDVTQDQAKLALGCVHLKCWIGEAHTIETRAVTPPSDVAQIWREVYVAALTTLLHYTDKPSAEAKRLADQAVADYRSALEQTDENS